MWQKGVGGGGGGGGGVWYSPIDHHLLPTGLGRREGEKKGRVRRERIFRVRSSHFSLYFFGDRTVKLR